MKQLPPFKYDCTSHVLAGAIRRYAPHNLITIDHIEAQLELDIPAKTLIAKVNYRLNRHPKAPQDESIRFNAVHLQDLHVESHDFHYDGKVLTITPKQVVTELELTYKVVEPLTGLHFGKDYVVTSNESEQSRYWLPSIDAPGSKASITFELVCDPSLTALANGKFKGSTTVEGKLFSTWEQKHKQPSYLYCIAVGVFSEYDDGQLEGIPVKYYGTSDIPVSYLKDTFARRTKSMIQFLRDKLGMLLPWPKYYQLVTPSTTGAMENTSLVTWFSYLCGNEKYVNEWALTLDTVNLHEMAHSYFGDMINVHYFDHTWLKEGFATFMECVWVEDTLGDQMAEYYLETELRGILQPCLYTRKIVENLYSDSFDIFDLHTYSGGCYRLSMLRKLLGNDVFWQGIKEYMARYAWKSPDSYDFKKVMEEISGRNLTGWFDQWVFNGGHPRLEVRRYHYDPKTHHLSMSFSQVQKATSPSCETFHMSFPVTVKDSTGYSVTQRLEWNTQEFIHHEYDQGLAIDRAATLNVALKGDPTSISIDPGYEALFRLSDSSLDDFGIPLLKSMLTESHFRSKLWAYKNLVANGCPLALRAVSESIANEPFWGLRVLVAQELGAARFSAHAARILVEMAKRESEIQAKWRIMAQLVNHRGDSCVYEYVKSLLDNSEEWEKLGYGARAAVYASLSATSPQESLESNVKRLIETAKNPPKDDCHGRVLNGVYSGLEHSRSLEAFKYVLECVEKIAARAKAADGGEYNLPFERNVCRRMFTRLGELANKLEVAPEISTAVRRSAISAVKKNLSHPDSLVRLGVIDALLGPLDDCDHLEEIERALKSTFHPNEWSSQYRRMYSLKASEGDGSGALGKRLGEAETKLRKLTEKLEKLESATSKKEEGQAGQDGAPPASSTANSNASAGDSLSSGAQKPVD